MKTIPEIYSSGQSIFFRLDGNTAHEGKGKFVKWNNRNLDSNGVWTGTMVVTLTKPCKEYVSGVNLIIDSSEII